jgi:hypothetical protein
MRSFACARISVYLCGLFLLGLASTACADTFDVPLRKHTIDFALSRSNPPGGTNFRVKLDCFFYSDFLIKQYNDEGEKRALWIAVLPIGKDASPPCSRKHLTGERIFKWPEWSGYFRGVKGTLVFLDADDGTNGGMPFVIYDFRTGKKIFEDNAYESSMWNKVPRSAFDDLRVNQTPDGETTLLCLRVAWGGCDPHSEGPDCWAKVRKKFGLKSSKMPVCNAYEETQGRWWTSVIAYPVETTLFPHPATRTIEGPVLCWPVD